MGYGQPQKYNDSMGYYRLGHAFLTPQSTTVVKLGCCGYIDDSGYWCPMVDIVNKAATTAGGYDVMDKSTLLKLPPSPVTWGPKMTETVKESRSSLTADAPVPGIPVEASLKLEFSLHADFGAVLLCKGEVTRRAYAHADPFRAWAQANAARLLTKYPAIRQHGFYVVTNTHASKDVLVNSWENGSHMVTLGFGGGVDQSANISSSTEIYGATSAAGWVKPVCKANEEMVVFFGGLKFEYRKLTGWMRGDTTKFAEKPIYRGDNIIVRDPDDEEDGLEILDSEIGQDII
ncbi:hypothetical protein BP6252_13329 [Coleophoma cylindrospora]|uniref:Uncharacterized protein n=1 Tax=Coleophoma cylindrospora TaxID=1849047 RepID=A0A3D8QAJ0_9HELO|nr:hypothetical protein BP6252_13329 [Coleophoma cylindrospora]